MKLRYLYVDQFHQLRKIRKSTIQALWDGEIGTETIANAEDQELRIATILCNNRLHPRKIYLMRLPLMDGQFTVESYLTLQLFSQPEHVTAKEAFDHHTTGWPDNFFHQLAVAIDVPCHALEVPVGIGGPLFLAAALRITPQQAVRYLR